MPQKRQRISRCLSYVHSAGLYPAGLTLGAIPPSSHSLRLLAAFAAVAIAAEHLAVMIKSHIRITEAIILHAEHDAVLLTQSFRPQQGQHF